MSYVPMEPAVDIIQKVFWSENMTEERLRERLVSDGLLRLSTIGHILRERRMSLLPYFGVHSVDILAEYDGIRPFLGRSKRLWDSVITEWRGILNASA